MPKSITKPVLVADLAVQADISKKAADKSINVRSNKALRDIINEGSAK